MRLKTRLSVAFLLVAWVPLGASVWLLTDRMDDDFQRSFDARCDAIESAVQARLGAIAGALDSALGHIADDPLLGRELLEPLEHGQFYGGAGQASEFERAIVREAQRLVASAAVDTLRVVDLQRDGHVIAMGHRGGFEPGDSEVLELSRARPDGTFLRRERVENLATGGADAAWTLQRLRVVDGRVALVGGKRVDRALLDDLRMGAGVGTELSLVAADGERVAATFDGASPGGGPRTWEVGTSPLVNVGDPRPVATLSVFVSRVEAATRQRRLWLTAGILASASAALALLAGLFLSRRISRPLEDLAEAASAVAGGARDRQVLELRGRGEVAALTRAFNQMTLDLSAGEERLRQSERVAAWREIARRIAHEIKNPLFPIQMSIETLKKVWDRRHPQFEEIFEESTATILEEVERMKHIVTEFSDFARMPAPRRVVTDLVEVAAAVVGLMADAAPEGIAIGLTGARRLEAVVDGDQIRQALMNLVKNAVEAIAAAPAREAPEPADATDATDADEISQAGQAASVVRRGRVEVRIEPDGDGDGDGARIVVVDDGPGMEPDTVAKLFVPYFTTKSEGTGLGLAIVHRIIEEHGGSISVESQPGVGTRFAMRLR